MRELNRHINEIKELCKANKVKTLFAFGSSTKDNLTPESDIDFVVDIDEPDPFSYTDHYFELKFRLEDLFKRRIDLIEERVLKNELFKEELNKTKVLVYG